MSRLSAEATAQQRREVEQLAGALYDEQQALQARQRLIDEGRSVIDRTRTATEGRRRSTVLIAAEGSANGVLRCRDTEVG
jgi:hypothetical protein